MTYDGIEIGSTATYTCDSGFELVGETTATCTETGDGNSGSFQPDPPTCQRMYILYLHVAMPLTKHPHSVRQRSSNISGGSGQGGGVVVDPCTLQV